MNECEKLKKHMDNMQFMDNMQLLYTALGDPKLDEYMLQQKIIWQQKQLATAKRNEDKKKIEKLSQGLKTIKPSETKRINPDTCCFCGIREGNIPAKKIFSSSYTNFDLLRNKSSKTLCECCVVVMKTLSFRQSSWIANVKGITLFKRDEAAKILFSEKEIPFSIYITTSFKKLGQLKATTSHNSNVFNVQFEEIQLLFDVEKLRETWEIVRLFYSIPEKEQEKKNPCSFFTKEEMRTGNYKFNRIRNFGLPEWREKEKTLKKKRGSSAFELLLYIVNQENHKKKENISGKTTGKTKIEGRRLPDDGKRLDIPGMEIDQMGQRKWF